MQQITITLKVWNVQIAILHLPLPIIRPCEVSLAFPLIKISNITFGEELLPQASRLTLDTDPVTLGPHFHLCGLVWTLGHSGRAQSRVAPPPH